MDFVLLLLVLLVIFSIIASERASSAGRRVAKLTKRIDALEREVSKIVQAKSPPAGSAPAQDSVHTGVPEGISETPEAEHVPGAPADAEEPVVVQPARPPRSIEAEEAKQEETEEPATPFQPLLARIDWEQFMGVRLFAWLGGFALFLAAAFFVKYSLDHGLIPPWLRVTIGFATGVGLLAVGVRMSQNKYKITADTLCGTGVVILYAMTFVCHSVYHFPLFTPNSTFEIMALITGGAFFLSVRLNAVAVVVLGMLGGFLTPALVSTGVDNPVGLFTYVALLDIGLIAVASARRWHWLTLAAAICTVLTEFGWVVAFFEPAKAFTAMAVFLGFCALFLGANLWSQQQGLQSTWLDAATVLLPAATFLFVPALIFDTMLGHRPVVIYPFVLGADLTLIGLALSQAKYRIFNQVGGIITFLLLAVWTREQVNDALLFWALGGYLVFAVLHTVVPIYMQREHPDRPIGYHEQLFPIIALVITIVPLLEIDSASGIIWPFVLIVNVLSIMVAIVAASVTAIVVVMFVTVGMAFLWVGNTQVDVLGMLAVLGGVTVVFTVAGMVVGQRILERQRQFGADNDRPFLPAGWSPENLQQQIPALSAILPFLLLAIVTERVPLASPVPVFAFALGLGALMLGLSRFYKHDWLPAVGLVCTYIVEMTWHLNHFTNAHSGVALAWYLVFYTAYLVFPFLFLKDDPDRNVSWITASLSGPLHFLLVYNLVERAMPNDYMGIIPALFAVTTIFGLAWLIRHTPIDHPRRNTLLAWFGGVSLLFVTLIFPIQFERQWITISWALEGAALIWLFRRVAHEGLRYTGLALLTIAFLRLTLNISVLDYSPRSAIPILNWYLYTYGLVIAALFAGAKLLKKPHHTVYGEDARPWLLTMGAVLAFFLLNIEIADFFAEPGQPKLIFRFSGNFARDLSYTIGWGLFAFGLMLIGLLKEVKECRWAAIALLGVTLLKLFFHDLSALNQLYRVAALVGIAVIAILVSFLYQKFLREEVIATESDNDVKPDPD